MARDLLGTVYANANVMIPATSNPVPRPMASLGVATSAGRIAKLRTSSFRTAEQMPHVRIPVPEPTAITAKTPTIVPLAVGLIKHHPRRQSAMEQSTKLSCDNEMEPESAASATVCSRGKTIWAKTIPVFPVLVISTTIVASPPTRVNVENRIWVWPPLGDAPPQGAGTSGAMLPCSRPAKPFADPVFRGGLTLVAAVPGPIPRLGVASPGYG